MPITTATIASIASSELVKKILEPLATKLGIELAGKAKEKWKKYTHSFEKYLAEVESKHKYFSSQIFANEGQLLEHYYVPLTLQKVGSSARKATVVVNSYPSDLLSAYKDVLIVDTAGMGKSTLLKFIFLKTIEHAASVPIFVELRKLSSERSLREFISEELALAGDEIGNGFLEDCLNEGVFPFFLDGFDEIPDDDKKVVSEQIVELKSRANGNRFILSSREEQSLAYLSEFHKFNIRPLSQEEAFNLIRKISPDPKISNSLIDKAGGQAKENLSEFLTNPLLVSLLVKSYLHSPILPVRFSEFYRRVFDALVQTHDARKELGGFIRKKKSGLNLDRFHKALRALGVLTYQDHKLEFSTDDLLFQIERAKDLTSEKDYSASGFQHDLLHAVPLFAREGSSSRWAHRSLQEYFAAAYICVDAKQDQPKFLEQLYASGVSKHANLLKLCADIDGKTFKHVLVKRYLSERLDLAERSFLPCDFPEIDNDFLERRRSLLYEDPPSLIVLPRALPGDAAWRRITTLFPEIKFRWQYFGFTSAGSMATSQQDKVKYFISVVANRYSTMDSIISTYFHEKIVLSVKSQRIKKSMRNVPFDVMLRFDNIPSNPLYSPANFEISLQLIWNMSSYFHRVFDVERIKVVYEDVKNHEQKALGLAISFD